MKRKEDCTSLIIHRCWKLENQKENFNYNKSFLCFKLEKKLEELEKKKIKKKEFKNLGLLCYLYVK